MGGLCPSSLKVGGAPAPLAPPSAATVQYSHGAWFLDGRTSILVSAGAGYGTYTSVDFALLMDVLKNKQDHAKDIAVWHQVCVYVHMEVCMYICTHVFICTFANVLNSKLIYQFTKILSCHCLCTIELVYLQPS